MPVTSSPRRALIVVFLAGGLVLNFPLLSVFSREASVAGVPVLVLALFGIWAAVIAATAAILRRPARHEVPPQAPTPRSVDGPAVPDPTDPT